MNYNKFVLINNPKPYWFCILTQIKLSKCLSFLRAYPIGKNVLCNVTRLTYAQAL